MSSDEPFAVAILAGGRSTRMGRDKALIEVGGRTLLDRQIELAWSLAPTEVLVSGRTQRELGERRARGVIDAQPGQGPLGGLAAVLAATAAAHVLVLAVDMPALTSEFLRGLLALRQAGVGAVPRTERGWEPTVALYPRQLVTEAQAELDEGRRALHDFVEVAVLDGRLLPVDVEPEEAVVLTNWNTPADVGPIP